MEKDDSGVLNLSKTFSSERLEKLKAYPDLKDAHIGGSISRYEALPMSDADIVYFGPARKLAGLNLEKIDRVDNFALTDSVVERLFACISPEVGFLDSRPIDGEAHKYYRRHNEKQFLLNRFLWDYTFSRRFNERSDEGGYNLKYSIGAYRDILLINMFGRSIDDSFIDGKPEILQSLDKISGVADEPYDALLESIELIMLTKSAVLAAHSGTPTRGRTQLNDETLRTAFRSNDFFADSVGNNTEFFWKKYLEGKKRIGAFLDKLFRYAVHNCDSMIYDYTGLALDLSQKKAKRPIKSLLADALSEKFPVMTCIIFDERITDKDLAEITKRCSGDPGHFYTNRLIAKSPITNDVTLRFLLKNSNFSIDDDTNNRYRLLIENKLGKHD